MPSASPALAAEPAVTGRCRCPGSADGCCDFTALGAFPDESGLMPGQQVWRCRHCGVGISMPPLPDPAFLYSGRESQDFQPDSQGLARAIKQVFFRRQARALLKSLPGTHARVLDFGCGSGLFTRCLGDVAVGSTVTGSDFHPVPPPELAGRPYLPMAEQESAADQFDLVLAMHVLEHDDDAAALLARIVRMARPGGTLVLEVPDIDCLWASVFGPQWDAWYLPYHRTHFSRASLLQLLAEAGLEVLEVRPACVPTMGRTLANLCGAGNSLPFLLAGAALHPLQWLGEVMTGRPSALRVVARRPA